MVSIESIDLAYTVCRPCLKSCNCFEDVKGQSKDKTFLPYLSKENIRGHTDQICGHCMIPLVSINDIDKSLKALSLS